MTVLRVRHTGAIPSQAELHAEAASNPARGILYALAGSVPFWLLLGWALQGR
jgi:hypothetical protein